MSRLLKKLIVLVSTIVLTCGCVTQDTGTEDEIARIQTPMPTKSPEPLVESPLNDLDKKEFLKQYHALPDNHVFKVSKKLSESGKLSKKEIREMGDYLSIDGYDYLEENPNSEVEESSANNRGGVSLKGIRFFQEIKILRLISLYVADIQELSFLDIDDIDAIDCAFKENLEGVFPMPNKKNSTVRLNGCNLTNLNFLNNIKKLNATVDLSDNKIKDISTLNRFKNQSIAIDLSSNIITDISVFNEFTVPLKELGLAGNRILDIRPLKNVLVKDTILKIGDNGVLDYSSIGDFMENYYYKNNNIYFTFKRSDYFRIDKPAGYQLIVNQKEIQETSKNRFIYFNTETIEDNQVVTLESKPRPACNAIMFMEQLGGVADYNTEKGILTCTLNGKYYVFRDFEIEVDCDGQKKTMYNPMKRMQGDIPYIAIDDMCEVFGLNISMGRGRTIVYCAGGPGDTYEQTFTDKVDVSWSSEGK